MRRGAFCLFLLLCLLASPVSATPARPQNGGPVVRIPQGLLRGAGSGIHLFKDIPYAAPPVGALRWLPPQPPPSWSGIRDAAHAGPACMQPPSYAHIARDAMSEDCLYLNIWVPAQGPKKRLPVLVWIHGGGFVVGSGSVKEDDGENLARKGMVVVTLNYRLGIFGFLAHPDLTRESPHHTSGNYGLLDQIAALRWVKKNIGHFGGDPDKVTLAGQSAGATSIGYLLTSPLARGLFERAIVESPAQLFLPARELKKSFQGLLPAEEIGRAMNPSLAAMRTWSTDKVMRRAAQVTHTLFRPVAGSRPSHPQAHEEPWWPFVDGWVVPRQLAQAYAGDREIVVPLLLGTNADEGSIFLTGFPAKTQQEYRAYLEENFAPCAKAIFHLYPASTPAEIHSQAVHIYTDAYFRYGARTLAQAERRREREVFLYRFTRVGPDEQLAKLGAWHGSELAYVFGHTGHDPSRKFNAKDQEISEEMMDAWARFAATGNPNGGRLPAWPAWSAKEHYMDFGDSPNVRTISHTRRFDVFAQLFSAKRDGAAGCPAAQ